MQFKLDLRLARLLGIHTQTRPVIINALWQYIKTHRLQDPAEREYINCDKYLEQVPPLSTVLVLLWVHTVDHPWVRGLGDGSWLVWDPPASGPCWARVYQLWQVPRTGACWLSVCCLLSSDLLLVLCTNLTFGCAVCLYGDYGANAGVIVGCISPVCFVHRFSSVRGWSFQKSQRDLVLCWCHQIPLLLTTSLCE